MAAAARRALLKAGELVRNIAYDEAPKRTTDLARSIVVEDASALGEPAVRVAPTTDYADHVHEGTGLWGPKQAKFVIAAKNKKALRFQGKGGPVMRKKVMHPGQPPDRFLERAFNKAEPQVADIIADEMAEAAAEDIAKELGTNW